MGTQRETREETQGHVTARRAPVAGTAIVWSGSRPAAHVLDLEDGAAVELGRDALEQLGLDDEHASRRQARLSKTGGVLEVEDLGSRNGTWVDGRRVKGAVKLERFAVLRVGRTLISPVRDAEGLKAEGVEVVDGAVLGPQMRAAWAEIGRAARAGGSVLVLGESGTGKELAARAFHRFGPAAKGPFVAVNAATIQPELAERLLFGAKRGAYSDAKEDAEGLVQAADGGTLFLDEVGELPQAVQAKLLRALETREVMPLGATKGRKVDFRLCAATWRDLLASVAEAKFRSDLYFRIGKPEVRLPPLRERLEELPHLVAGTLGQAGLAAHALAVEACLLRAWPGNVRELLAELKRAAQLAKEEGRDQVTAADLAAVEPAPAAPAPPGERERIEAALKAAGGNVTKAAEALGMHRTQLRRWLAKRG